MPQKEDLSRTQITVRYQMKGDRHYEYRIYRDQKAFSHDLNTITERVLKWEVLK